MFSCWEYWRHSTYPLSPPLIIIYTHTTFRFIPANSVPLELVSVWHTVFAEILQIVYKHRMLLCSNDFELNSCRNSHITCIIMKLADLELHAMERSDVTLSLSLPYISVYINHNSNSIPN